MLSEYMKTANGEGPVYVNYKKKYYNIRKVSALNIIQELYIEIGELEMDFSDE